MSKRKIAYLDKKVDTIDDLLNEAGKLKEHIESMAIAIVLDKSDEDTTNRVMWYVTEEHMCTLVGLLEALKLKVME